MESELGKEKKESKAEKNKAQGQFLQKDTTQETLKEFGERLCRIEDEIKQMKDTQETSCTGPQVRRNNRGRGRWKAEVKADDKNPNLQKTKTKHMCRILTYFAIGVVRMVM